MNTINEINEEAIAKLEELKPLILNNKNYLNIYLGRFNVALNQFKDCSETDAVCKSKAITNVNEKETLIYSKEENITKAVSTNADIVEYVIEKIYLKRKKQI